MNKMNIQIPNTKCFKCRKRKAKHQIVVASKYEKGKKGITNHYEYLCEKCFQSRY